MKERFFYCPVCGGTLKQEIIVGEKRRVCSSCHRINFENPIVGTAGIVLSNEKKILLGRRAEHVSYAGLWCIPCGYVEYNEDIRQAVVREMKEETGLDVLCGKVFAVHSNFHNPKQHTVGVWFMCDIISGIPQPGDDVVELGWFKLDELPDLAFPTDYIVIDDLTKI